MAAIKLKHYKLYKKKLLNYANAVELRVRYIKTDYEEGSYSQAKSKITMASGLPQSVEISILLHELGHASDETLNNPTSPRLALAYESVYAEVYTKAQLKRVIECEKRAWKYGRKLAKILRIRLGKWYADVERYCLNNYRSQ